LIRVNAIWGAVADLRMCWFAIVGKLDAEFAKHGVNPMSAPPVAASHRRLRISGPWWRSALTMASAAGVTATMMDLRDLIDPAIRLPYPGIQLGVPIAAFAAALLASCAGQFAFRRAPAPIASAGRYATPSSSSDASLQCACLVLLVFGAVTFGL